MQGSKILISNRFLCKKSTPMGKSVPSSFYTKKPVESSKKFSLFISPSCSILFSTKKQWPIRRFVSFIKEEEKTIQDIERNITINYKSRQWNNVLNEFLKEKDSFSFSETSYNQAIEAALKTPNNHQNVVDIFNEMRAKKIKPSLESFQAVLYVFQARTAINELCEAYEHLLSLHRPDVQSTRLILSSLEGTEDFEKKGLKLLEEAVEKGLEPESKIWQLVVTHFAKVGNYDKLEFWFNQVKDFQFFDGSYPMFHAILFNTPLELSLKYFQQMKQYSFTSTTAYNYLIDRCLLLKKFDLGFRLYEDMKTDFSNLRPSATTFSIILSILYESKKFRELPKYLNDMHFYEVEPDESLYSLIIRLASRFDLSLATKYFTKMQQNIQTKGLFFQLAATDIFSVTQDASGFEKFAWDLLGENPKELNYPEAFVPADEQSFESLFQQILVKGSSNPQNSVALSFSLFKQLNDEKNIEKKVSLGDAVEILNPSTNLFVNDTFPNSNLPLKMSLILKIAHVASDFEQSHLLSRILEFWLTKNQNSEDEFSETKTDWASQNSVLEQKEKKATRTPVPYKAYPLIIRKMDHESAVLLYLRYRERFPKKLEVWFGTSILRCLLNKNSYSALAVWADISFRYPQFLPDQRTIEKIQYLVDNQKNIKTKGGFNDIYPINTKDSEKREEELPSFSLDIGRSAIEAEKSKENLIDTNKRVDKNV